jgi:arsenate reductase (thioredoxin)
MGEALMRKMVGDRYEIFSAGTHPSPIHPLAVVAMREIGIDLRDHESKSVDEFRDTGIDMLITVCDHATEVTPRYLACARRTHWSLPDPADVEGPEEVRLEAFRSVRDTIKHRLSTWLEPDAPAAPVAVLSLD